MPTTTVIPTTSPGAQLGQDLLNIPFPDMVKNLGVAIAQAQLEMDLVSMKIAQLMAGYDADATSTPGKGNSIDLGGTSYNMLQLGFMPTFYQFVDTVIEVKISIQISTETSIKNVEREKKFQARLSRTGGLQVNTSTVSATYQGKYSYSAEGSSMVRTKIVPVPPPAILEQKLKELAATTTTT